MSDQPSPLTPTQRIERAEREVIRLTGSGPGGQLDKHFRMTVPAEPDRDSDLVLMDGLAAGREAIAARAGVRDLPTVPDEWDSSTHAIASALYETDPPESWMRTGTDEYRRRADAMLAVIRGAGVRDPDPAAFAFHKEHDLD